MTSHTGPFTVAELWRDPVKTLALNAGVVRPGVIRVGDTVELRRPSA